MRLLYAVILLMLTLSASAQSSLGKAKIDSVAALRALDPVEGVWQFPDDGATIAVIRTYSDTYNVYLLDSPRLDIRPGIIIGRFKATPKPGVYDGTLESKKFGKRDKLSSHQVTFKVTDHGWLVIEPYKQGVTVDLRRWMNRVLHFSVSTKNERPKGLDGAKRVYPYILSDHYPIVL